MKVQGALFCEFVRALPDGKCDIFGVFDSLSPPQVPFLMQLFFIYWNVLLDPSEELSTDPYRVTMVVIPPSKKDFVRSTMEAVVTQNWPGESIPMLPLAVPIAGVTFREYGIYTSQVTINGHTLDGPKLLVRKPLGEKNAQP